MMDNMTMMYIPDLAAQNGEGGSYVYGYGLTLAKAVELWQLGVRGELSPKTVVWYAGMLKHLLIYYGPETQVEALTLDDLRRYRAYLLDERKNQRTGNPLSVNTVDAHVRAIKGFFSWLQKDGKIKKNPSQRLKRPDLPKRGRRGVSDADAEKMFAAAMPLMDEAERAEAAQMLRGYLSAGRQLVGHGAARQKLLVMVGKVRAVAMLSVLASTACRLGGFCGLQVHDLELDGSQALIHEKGNKERPVFFATRGSGGATGLAGGAPSEHGCDGSVDGVAVAALLGDGTGSRRGSLASDPVEKSCRSDGQGERPSMAAYDAASPDAGGDAAGNGGRYCWA